MGRSFELMAQHFLVQSFIPAWRDMSFLDPQLDSAQPMERGLEVYQTVRVSCFSVFSNCYLYKNVHECINMYNCEF